MSDCAGVGGGRAQHKWGRTAQNPPTKSAVWQTVAGGEKTTPPTPARTERAPSTSRDRGRANRAQMRDQHAYTEGVRQARGHPARPCRTKWPAEAQVERDRTPFWGAPAPRPPTRDKRTHCIQQARCTTRQPVTSPLDGGLPRPAGVGPKQGHKHRPPTARCLTQAAKGTPHPSPSTFPVTPPGRRAHPQERHYERHGRATRGEHSGGGGHCTRLRPTPRRGHTAQQSHTICLGGFLRVRSRIKV